MDPKDITAQVGESVKAQLEDHKQKLDAQIAEFTEKNGEMAEAVKAEFKGKLEENLTKFDKLQEQVDKMETAAKKRAFEGREKKSRIQVIGDHVMKNKELFKAYTQKGVNSMNFMIDDPREAQKATITEDGNLTGEVIEADYVPGIIYGPERRERIRQYLPTGVTNSDQVVYNRETSYTDGTQMTGENIQPSTETEFDLTRISSPVRKIMAYARISNEMLEDLPQVASYLNTRMTEKLLNKEDQQLLYGDDTGDNLEGITTVANSFSGSGFSVTTPETWDVLRIAMTELRVQAGNEYYANAIMMNPTDVALMDLAKDSNGEYQFPGYVIASGGRTVYGVPVIQNTAITAGEALVGDFTLGAQLFQRRGIEVQIARENQDDFVKDTSTIRITERLTLAIYRTPAFMYFDIATAKTAVTAS